MNENLKNKLHKYSILAGATISSTSVLGDIVYTDINHDTVLNNHNEIFSIDINNDLNVDFFIKERIFGGAINYIDVGGYFGLAYNYFIPV